MSGRLCSRGLQRSFATSTRVLNSPTSQSLAAKVAPIEPIAPAPPPRRVSAHVRRIETVEKELKALTERTAEKNDVSKLRAEMKQLYDGLHIEFLDLRAHVWGLREYHFSSSTFA
ncbi:SubName: Full=Uncharacterized protein {ECO:0000313/EMBL:CCA67829.1} [Serendipita indica DSM 11827]|nr:SubName: Full=Uncharacterized protein {ECO:0000313/EMBL:CCA67829.1} [Serendipita indica DSM 11827]